MQKKIEKYKMRQAEAGISNEWKMQQLLHNGVKDLYEFVFKFLSLYQFLSKIENIEKIKFRNMFEMCRKL